MNCQEQNSNDIPPPQSHLFFFIIRATTFCIFITQASKNTKIHTQQTSKLCLRSLGVTPKINKSNGEKLAQICLLAAVLWTQRDRVNFMDLEK